jgi:hypothetical protein
MHPPTATPWERLATTLSDTLAPGWSLDRTAEGFLLSANDPAFQSHAPALARALETVLAAARPGLPKPEIRVAGTLPDEPGRPEGLVEAAQALARRAARQGRAFALGPMSVNDRRQVHQALTDMPEVWTQSDGDGIFRRLWIVPRKARHKETPAAT